MNRGTKFQISDRMWSAIGATEEFLALKYRPGYTPRQIMEIRGSFIYFSFILSITLIAALFQAMAGVKHTAIMTPLILNSIAALLAFQNYRKKRAQQYSVREEWAAALLFAVNIIMARYIYALVIGWEFALSSYNLSVFFISSVISSIMLYNRRLFRTVFFIILINWIVFLTAAKLSGAGMHLRVTDIPTANSGFNILRELFVIIIYIFLSAAVYIYMSIISAYERRSVQQQKTIADYNRFLSDEVDKKTAELQNELNEKIRATESLRILSEAVKFSPIGISITDTEGSIVYTNPWFQAVTGYSLEEIKGKRPGPLLNKNLPREKRQEIYSTVRTGGEWHGELMNIRKNGEEFWDRVSISSIKDSGKKITHYVAIQEDITARKRMEADLTESENRLRERNMAMEKDISIAEVVQRTILQPEPSNDSLFRRAFKQVSAEKIGGDFIAMKSPSPAELCIFIGDVSGHGVASALFTSLIKFITDDLFRRHHNDPVAYMSGLNAAVSGYMFNYFITGIYAYLKHDPASGTCDLYFSNGGHPSPVIIRPDQSGFIAESHGPLIGLHDEASYKLNHVGLESGSSLFLFTDGVPETTGKETGELLGFDSRLLQLFIDSAAGSIDEALDRIILSLDSLRGAPEPEDDLLIAGIVIP